MQVSAAVRQGSPSTSGRPLENGNSAHASSASHSQPPQRLPESAETALLYVRFRTVAEPGLKGGNCQVQERLAALASVVLPDASWQLLHAAGLLPCLEVCLS